MFGLGLMSALGAMPGIVSQGKGLVGGWQETKGQGLGTRLKSAVQGGKDQSMMGQIEAINDKLDNLTEKTHIDPQLSDPTADIEQPTEEFNINNNAVSSDLSAVADPNQESPGLPYQGTKYEEQ